MFGVGGGCTSAGVKDCGSVRNLFSTLLERGGKVERGSQWLPVCRYKGYAGIVS